MSMTANRDRLTQYSIDGAAVPTITRTASFVATATVTSGTVTSSMINYGCYDGGQTRIQAFGASAVPIPVESLADVDVDRCANYCFAQGFTWSAVTGPRTNTRCICGNDIATTGDTLAPINMEYCNEPCQGTGSQQNCAGSNRAIIYAVAESATTGPWYTSSTAYYGTRVVSRTTGAFSHPSFPMSIFKLGDNHDIGGR